MAQLITLPINNNTYIQGAIAADNAHCMPLTEINLILNENQIDTFAIYDDCLIDFINTVTTMIPLALNKELIFPTHMNQDIGYLWNKEIERTIYLTDEEKINDSETWFGYKYLFFSTPSNFNPHVSTWLFNQDNKIILKVTPVYTWNFIKYNEKQNIVNYQNFMHSYKPFKSFELSKEAAHEWLNQAQKLSTIVKENM